MEKWTNTEIDYAIELHLNGYTYKVVGEEFGRSISSVEGALRRFQEKVEPCPAPKKKPVKIKEPYPIKRCNQVQFAFEVEKKGDKCDFIHKGRRVEGFYVNGVVKSALQTLLDYNRKQVERGEEILMVEGITDNY